MRALPKPFYEDSHVTLYNGDCRDLAPLLPRARVAIADPPYGETSLPWDKWPKGWPAAVIPAADQIWCWGSARLFLTHASEFTGWKFAQDIVWKKHNGTGNAKDRFRRIHELICHFYQGKWTRFGLKSLKIKGPIPTGKKTARRIAQPSHLGVYSAPTTYHYTGERLATTVIKMPSVRGGTNRTQKPESLIETLLRYSAAEGGIVHDYFSGSGTVPAVAKRLGLRCYAIEAEESQCHDIAARCAAITAPAPEVIPLPAAGGLRASA